jgi:hypothetical protein
VAERDPAHGDGSARSTETLMSDRSSLARLRLTRGALWLVLLPLASGCITMSGDRLADLEPARPPRVPHLEQTVGDFSFHLDGGKLVTSNRMGRLLNDEVLARWKKAGFISGHSHAKASRFSGRAEYNLTLSGHQEGDSSVLLQLLSGLTLFVLPYWVKTDLDLRYTLEHVPTGRTFEAEAADDHTVVVSLLLLPASPFTQRGRTRTLDRLADHLYEQLHRQGAFDPESWPEPVQAVEVSDDGAPSFDREIAERLRRLDALRGQGLLSVDEYETKRREILDAL